MPGQDLRWSAEEPRRRRGDVDGHAVAVREIDRLEQTSLVEPGLGDDQLVQPLAREEGAEIAEAVRPGGRGGGIQGLHDRPAAAGSRLP